MAQMIDEMLCRCLQAMWWTQMEPRASALTSLN